MIAMYPTSATGEPCRCSAALSTTAISRGGPGRPARRSLQRDLEEVARLVLDRAEVAGVRAAGDRRDVDRIADRIEPVRPPRLPGGRGHDHALDAAGVRRGDH